MWKKQWSKLKTALSTPEEYIEETITDTQEEPEPTPVVVEPEYNTDQVISISDEHMDELNKTINSIRMLKSNLGELVLKYEKDRSVALDMSLKLNEKLAEQIAHLRTIYNVEPTADYTLNFGTPGVSSASLTRNSE